MTNTTVQESEMGQSTAENIERHKQIMSANEMWVMFKNDVHDGIKNNCLHKKCNHINNLPWIMPNIKCLIKH